MGQPIRLSIALPSRGTNPQQFTLSFGMLLASIERGMLGPCTWTLDPWLTSSLTTARELALADALKRGDTHQLCLDDDMNFEPEAVRLLFSRGLSVVATNYLMKKMPPDTFAAMGLDGQRLVTGPNSTGLQEVDFTGLGVGLLRLDIFKNIPRPWFQPMYDEERGYYYPDDVLFYRNLRKHGVHTFVDHDASKLVTHVGLAEWACQDYRPPQPPAREG